MAIKLLENVSFGLVRTNPKLSTNVKLVCDSNYSLTLDSFDANPELSDKIFKGLQVSPETKYGFDLYRFYDKGRIAPEITFDVGRLDGDLDIKKDFGKQYEMTYSMGAEAVNSDLYDEEFGLLAPLWIKKNIPNYFVIFKTEGPVNVNTSEFTGNDESAVKMPSFGDRILSNSKIIKTYDLTSNTALGQYLRNHIDDPDFPSTPFRFSTERNEVSSYRGINIATGGFTEKDEYIWSDLAKL